MTTPRLTGGGAALWQRAFAFAAWKHRNQTRRDGRTPYVSHVARVAMTVRDIFGCDDPEVLAAAVLHDTIEDTTTDYDDLAELFGPGVADLVSTLTKNMALPEAPREAEYDARLARGDWRARLIKLADVYDNYCDLGNDPREGRDKHEAKARDKCLRALTLASGDTAHEPSRLAAAAVRALLGGGGPG